jgi:hypothetical protein
MDYLLDTSPHRHGSLQDSDEVSRRQRTGGNASWEDWGMPARDHLGSRDHEEQPGHDRDTGRGRDQGEHEHNDAEGALMQIVYQPAQGEVDLRCLVV